MKTKEEVNQVTSEKCQRLIDLLIEKQNDPNFQSKCQQIIELFEKNGQRKQFKSN